MTHSILRDSASRAEAHQEEIPHQLRQRISEDLPRLPLARAIRRGTTTGTPTAWPLSARFRTPAAVSDDDLAVALSRRAKGESVTAIATILKVGRSTLYRALESHQLAAEAHQAQLGHRLRREDRRAYC